MEESDSNKGTPIKKISDKRSTPSPSKKGSNKKARPSLGINQPTITKFFAKLGTSSSSIGDVSSSLGISELYKEELDKFIQVINGEISRNDASALLEKAKGDVSVAVDMYYGNSGAGIGDGEVGLVLCSKPSQTQVFKETVKIPRLFVQGRQTSHADATYLALPLEKYDPVEHACWSAGQSAPYLHLARAFDLLEGERGKIKATGILCNMFRSVLTLSPEDVLPAVYLCTNNIAADHENMELNVGASLVTAALEKACGMRRSKIKELYNNLGDFGDVAQVCRQTQSLLVPPSTLLLREVLCTLQKISTETGNGSTTRKKQLIVDLMLSCREKEMKFFVRTLVRNLRIGAMMKTVLPALAQAVVTNSSPCLPHEGASKFLKEKLQCVSAAVVEAHTILPNLDILVPSLVSKGIDFTSETLSMVPGIPIMPMLARITNGVSQILKLFEGRAFTCEYKYDGQRAQIHKLNDGSVRVFSRKGDDMTSKFPDLVKIIKESCKTATVTFVVDAEVVAVDRKRCKLMSFQELSSRERGTKSSIITVDDIEVDICVFVFDVMFANGDKLLGSPLRQRRMYLKDLFNDEQPYKFEYAKEITVEAEDSSLGSEATLCKINSFLQDAFSSSCEGLIVKSLDVDARYVPSKRTNTWLKIKQDYMEGLNDTIDLVPIGAWHGNGRKAGWYSPFLMACYNPDTEEYQSVCRVMSGFSDSFYVEMREFFSSEKVLSKKPTYYHTDEVPDRWFSPELVWAIRGADFTVSPVHKAAIGLVHSSRGISIRFPRFIRPVSDRKAEDCSTAADISYMFQLQNRKMDIKGDD